MKVAVVGSGAAGLAATWLLNEYSRHEVHIYEADSRPGGHVTTVNFSRSGKEPIGVDLAFVAFNADTYPNFCHFLKRFPTLQERIVKAPMSFSVTRDGGMSGWASTNIRSFFRQAWGFLDARNWRMLYDIARFNACAAELLLKNSANGEITIGQYLEREGYSKSFADDYLIPLMGSIWSAPLDKFSLEFPARTLLQFMHNHGILRALKESRHWSTFSGGSAQYVDLVMATFPPAQVHLSTPVFSVNSRPKDGSNAYDVELTTASGEHVIYDHVILACPSNKALEILSNGGGVSNEEGNILDAIEWVPNVCVLHDDEKLMPAQREAWTAWNFMTQSRYDHNGKIVPNHPIPSITFWSNLLQQLPEERHGMIFVTENPIVQPDPSKTIARVSFYHPCLTVKTIKAQHQMHLIQRTRGISYAGAWMKYGFHEDAFTTGLQAARALFEDALPFEIIDSDSCAPVVDLQHAWIFNSLERSGARSFLFFIFYRLLDLMKNILILLGLSMKSRDAELLDPVL